MRITHFDNTVRIIVANLRLGALNSAQNLQSTNILARSTPNCCLQAWRSRLTGHKLDHERKKRMVVLLDLCSVERQWGVSCANTMMTSSIGHVSISRIECLSFIGPSIQCLKPSRFKHNCELLLGAVKFFLHPFTLSNRLLIGNS